MKKIYTLSTILLITLSVFAQAPSKLSYQAVVRDADNNLLSSQIIGMRLSILQGSVFGNSVYIETQSPISNINGLVSLEIGNGSVIFGALNSIDWSNGPYFIKTEADPEGGQFYTLTESSQLMSVPYALHANTADSIVGGLIKTETDPVFGASIANGITAIDTANWNNHTVDTDTQLDSADIANLGYNAGGITTEVDGSITNEIQDLQLVGNNLTITNNGTATTIDLSPYLDNTDTQLDSADIANLGYNAGGITTEVDGSITNEIQDLQLVGNNLTITNNGTATTIDLSPYLDNTDTQLDSADIANLGYNAGGITTEVDGSITNEIQDLQLVGNNLTITNNGRATTIDLSLYLDNTDTQLDSTDIANLGYNAGGIAKEVDGSITNEIQDLQLVGNNLTITNNGRATTIDLSLYLDNTDTQLDSTDIANLGYNAGGIAKEVDGSITNEIQDLQLVGNNLTITNNGRATTIDLSLYLDNTDTQLDSTDIANLGYNAGGIAKEVDGSITNEIQDLQLVGNNLTITNNGTATTIDLSTYLDNTDTQLDSAAIAKLGYNAGGIAKEVDGSITNEIQDLQLVGNNLTITNNGGATTIDLSTYLDNTDTQLDSTDIANLGYNAGGIAKEVDGSITNEIQDLQLVGNNLTITNNGGATTIDLSTYLDNTDTQLDSAAIAKLGFVAFSGTTSQTLRHNGTTWTATTNLSNNGTTVTTTADMNINGLTAGRGAGGVNLNTASGYQALMKNTTGRANTASGYQALYANNIGNQNTATGYHALNNNTTGNENTALGFNALRKTDKGIGNTASGRSL